MNPLRSAVYRVVEDIPEVGYFRGQLVAVTLAEGHGERRIGPDILAVIRWLRRGWLEEVAIPGPKTPECG